VRVTLQRDRKDRLSYSHMNRLVSYQNENTLKGGESPPFNVFSF
jgi:hypothetical protein